MPFCFLNFNKKLIISIVCLLPALALATQQDEIDVADEPGIEDKYSGYQTTLDYSDRAYYGTDEEIFEDVLQLGDESRGSFLFDFGSDAGDFAGTGTSSFRDSYVDYGADFLPGASSFDSMNQGFRNEFNSLFARDDTLIREFSVPQPSYFNQGFNNPSAQSGSSQPKSFGQSSQGGANRSAGNSGSGNYDAEQPALIRWVFSVIGFVREHPVWTGVIALVVLSLISLIQVLVQKSLRPFG